MEKNSKNLRNQNPSMEEEELEPVPDFIFEERKDESMVSSNLDVVVRKTHFLKPSSKTSMAAKPVSYHPISVSSSSSWPLKVNFNGWGYPVPSWVSWVSALHDKHQDLWKRTCIYEPIMISTYRVRRDDDLIIGFAEKWCPTTNTFVFPWGEATVTLEDIMILGGFSVTGCPVSCNSCCVLRSPDLMEIESKLIRELLLMGTSISQMKWISHFKGSEIEHEAFLTFWLSRFVLSDSDKLIKEHLISIAILLAKGTCFAFAPAVLSSIYKDLWMLKECIVASSVNSSENAEVTLHSPLKFVQLWIWERFLAFQPTTTAINLGNPRSARWLKAPKHKLDNVRLALNSSDMSFIWRPYTVEMLGWKVPSFYKSENMNMWHAFDNQIKEEMKSYAICLRVSELVGLNCIQQYLPNRVALQFGMDQDIPANIARFNESNEIAWGNYMRPIRDSRFYIPSRISECGVTVRYSSWWKQESMMNCEDLSEKVVGKRSLRKRRKFVSLSSYLRKHSVEEEMSENEDDNLHDSDFVSNNLEAAAAKKSDNDTIVPPAVAPKCSPMEVEQLAVPPGFAPKCTAVKVELAVPPGFAPKCSPMNIELAVPPGFAPKCSPINIELAVPPGFAPKCSPMNIELSVPPGFAPKCNAEKVELGVPSVLAHKSNIEKPTTKTVAFEDQECLTTEITKENIMEENPANNEAEFSDFADVDISDGCQSSIQAVSHPTSASLLEESPNVKIEMHASFPPDASPKSKIINFDVPPGFAPKTMKEVPVCAVAVNEGCPSVSLDGESLIDKIKSSDVPIPPGIAPKSMKEIPVAGSVTLNGESLNAKIKSFDVPTGFAPKNMNEVLVCDMDDIVNDDPLDVMEILKSSKKTDVNAAGGLMVDKVRENVQEIPVYKAPDTSSNLGGRINKLQRFVTRLLAEKHGKKSDQNPGKQIIYHIID